MKFNFGWGDPYFLLDILSTGTMYKTITMPPELQDMYYAPDTGFEDLIKLTKETIKATSGLDYKYVIITAGATQAINSILKNEAKLGFRDVVMNKYGFPFYDDMVKNAGLTRRDSKIKNIKDAFILLDNPSNPLGKQEEISVGHDRVYWDSVYFNEIYNADLTLVPNHRAMIGSYSKLLGLTGARIGWIATNDNLYYKMIKDVSLKDTATVSVPSQKLIIDVLNNINIHLFMKQGQKSLNYNREEFQKIEKLFDNQPVQSVGMFYCAHADKKTIDLLNKCGISYMDLGDNFIRLSMGQTNTLTQKAINTMLKEDSI